MDVVAFFFHWTPAVMDAMDPAELMRCRESAIAIHNRLNTPEK
ncbi:GpE family phage tail protein [Comamonas terrigena]|uniref:GpE family phage tail protein n=1 Tax=Comamonas terrigena TaxID=32013 RepID=A0A2A7UY25_COMTR|nr:GpE family phage tail protein [Comamonas terrigena]PEH90148.1 GpE family phage tail protein [Comamonas terrigena]BBL25449.1 hypothetical protein CT3_29040 [Comamonas terrigena NBRC 13299]SUY70977.1 Phage P2 GpE [Comamonas terrigena]